MSSASGLLSVRFEVLIEGGGEAREVGAGAMALGPETSEAGIPPIMMSGDKTSGTSSPVPLADSGKSFKPASLGGVVGGVARAASSLLFFSSTGVTLGAT